MDNKYHDDFIDESKMRDNLLDEIEERLERNYKIGIMLGNAHSDIMTEKEKRDFREREYKDQEMAE